jgi:hypothetical protein
VADGAATAALAADADDTAAEILRKVRRSMKVSLGIAGL